MRVGEAFPSKYLKAADLGDANVPVTIREVKIENVGSPGEQEEKIIIYFEGKNKGLICNKTNANTIAKVVGSDDLDDWPGSKIVIYATEVQFKDEMVMAIRVRLKAAPAVQKPQRKPAAEEADDLSTELPEFGPSETDEGAPPPKTRKSKKSTAAEDHDGEGPSF